MLIFRRLIRRPRYEHSAKETFFTWYYLNLVLSAPASLNRDFLLCHPVQELYPDSLEGRRNGESCG